MLHSPEANVSLVPSMSLTMKGGSYFTVYDPIIVISTQVNLHYFVLYIIDQETVINKIFL